MSFVKIFKCYYKPKYLLIGIFSNIGLDYYNNKILGKLKILDIPKNIKINKKNLKYLCIKKYRIETYLTTCIISIIFGPISIISYLHDIYENYNIRKSYTIV
jgi:hypothetical protein